MAGRYDRINGAYCKVKKRYVRIGGAWTPVKKRFDKVNGVWAPSFNGEPITWTYTADYEIYGYSQDDVYHGTMGPDHNCTALVYISDMPTGSEYRDARIDLTVVYNFSKPFLMKTGKTISIHYTNNRGGHEQSTTFQIFINESLYHNYTESYVHEAQETYVFPSDVNVSKIRFVLPFHVSGDYSSGSDSLAAIINSDYGSFLLNNSGSSDQ